MWRNTGIKENVVDEIRELAQKYRVDQIILFGSRARGDYKERSDIDLAVIGGDFSRFSIDIDEVTSTLLKYDIVNLNGVVQSDLRESIKREGIVMYEKV